MWLRINIRWKKFSYLVIEIETLLLRQDFYCPVSHLKSDQIYCALYFIAKLLNSIDKFYNQLEFVDDIFDRIPDFSIHMKQISYS